MDNRDDRETDLKAAEKHLLLALGEFKTLPTNHEELIEMMRDYFADQKVEVFSRLIFHDGEEGFRDFIATTVIKSGFYFRDEDGQVKLRT